jgi:multicomponent Na+:H+ antiporter subunit D
VGGFISKWYLLLGALDAKSIGILVVLLTSTLLNAAYFVPVVYQAFFGQPRDGDAAHGFKEAHPAMVVPLALTAVISVAIGIYPNFFMHFAQALFP